MFSFPKKRLRCSFNVMSPFTELITSQSAFKLCDVTKFVILEAPCFVELVPLCPQSINAKMLLKYFGHL